MDKDEAINLLEGPFGKELFKIAMDYVSPIFWGVPEQNDKSIFHNGTAFPLDCGCGLFIATAAHVYEEYLEDKQKHRDLVCQLGDLSFNLEDRLIDYRGSKVLDIATFKISEKELNALNKNVLVGSNSSWPPRRVMKDEGVFFAGFPGLERTEPGVQECNFGLYASLTPVSSVSERHIGCAFERDEMIDILGLGIPNEGYDLGGVSGCPVLVLEESKAGIFSWFLGGVVYSASTELGEIVFAHHADYLLPDGRLNI
jgi:hypothetical protein